jgi:hypothetical protein
VILFSIWFGTLFINKCSVFEKFFICTKKYLNLKKSHQHSQFGSPALWASPVERSAPSCPSPLRCLWQWIPFELRHCRAWFLKKEHQNCDIILIRWIWSKSDQVFEAKSSKFGHERQNKQPRDNKITGITDSISTTHTYFRPPAADRSLSDRPAVPDLRRCRFLEYKQHIECRHN